MIPPRILLPAAALLALLGGCALPHHPIDCAVGFPWSDCLAGTSGYEHYRQGGRMGWEAPPVYIGDIPPAVSYEPIDQWVPSLPAPPQMAVPAPLANPIRGPSGCGPLRGGPYGAMC